MSAERRKQEVDILNSRYGAIEWGSNLDWILFKDFKLPTGWNKTNTPLLIMIPAGYPATPPDNFYVPNGLRLATGNPPANFAENQTVLGNLWAQFSFHAQGWNPASEILKGDNLQGFMLMVEKRLQELN